MAQTSHSRTQAVGLVGELDSADMQDTVSVVNAMTAVGDGTDELLFGTLVSDELALIGNAISAKRLDAQADKLAGILVRTDTFNKSNELGDNGIKPGVIGTVAKRGRVRVMLDETVAIGDTVRYYAKAVSGKHQGAFRTTDPTGTDTVVITAGAKFVSAGTTATGAWLEFDVLNMTFSSDS